MQFEDRVQAVATALLVGAGAKLAPEWFEKNENLRRTAENVRSDPRMLAALRGELPKDHTATP